MKEFEKYTRYLYINYSWRTINFFNLLFKIIESNSFLSDILY